MPRFFNHRDPLSVMHWINSAAFGIELSGLLGAATNLSLGALIASAFGLDENASMLEVFIFRFINIASAHAVLIEMQEETTDVTLLLQLLRMSIYSMNFATSLINAPAPNENIEPPARGPNP